MTTRHELHLPAFQDNPKEPSVRTLDEIDRLIEEDYALFFDRESYERQKRELSVDRPFVLPPTLHGRRPPDSATD